MELRWIVLLWLPAASLAQTSSLISVMENSELDLERDFAARIPAVESSYGQTINIQSLPFQRKESSNINKEMCSRLEKSKISAVLDMAWGGWIRGRRTANQLGLPYYRVDTSNHPFIKAISDFLSQSQVVDAVFVFNTKEELDQCMYYIIMYSELRISGAWLKSSDSLNKIRDLKPRPANVVLFGSKDTILSGLVELENRDIIKRDSYFNLVFTDFADEETVSSDVSSFFPGNMTSKIFTMSSSTCCSLLKKSGGTCNCNKPVMNMFLESAGEVIGSAVSILNGDSSTSVELQWNCASNLTPNVRESLDKQVKQFSLDNGILCMMDTNNVTLLTAPVNININLLSNKRLSKIGSWEAVRGFQSAPGYQVSSIRRFFRVGVVLGKPWAWIEEEEPDKQINPKNLRANQKNKGLVGYTIDLLEQLAEKMKFDYEIVVASDNKYGNRKENGEWTGIMGDLIRGDIDISVASLIMTTEREEYIDFVTPYFDQSGISILLREKYTERNMFKFLLVLKDEVWFGILGSVVVVILLLWLLDKWSPYSYVNNREAYPEGAREFTFGECVWFGLTSLTPQGGGECPKSLSARVLVAAYWLFIVLMLATFTANLAALLTVERMQTTVQSLEELARQSQVNYTALEGSPTMEYFKNMAGAEDALYKKWKEMTLNSTSEQTKFRVWDYPIREQYSHIYNVIQMVGPPKNEEDGYKRVRESLSGDFAFIHDASEVKYQYYTNCEFLEIGEQFAEQPLAVAVQEGSSLVKEISQEILALQKDRFFERVHSKFWDIGQRSACPVMNDNEGITLESLGGIFLTTLVGLVLSVIMLAYEVYTEKKEENSGKVTPAGFLSKQNLKDDGFYRDMYNRDLKNGSQITRNSSGTYGGNVIRVGSKHKLSDIS